MSIVDSLFFFPVSYRDRFLEDVLLGRVELLTSNTLSFITDVYQSAFSVYLINICGYRNIIPGHNFVVLP